MLGSGGHLATAGATFVQSGLEVLCVQGTGGGGVCS